MNDPRAKPTLFAPLICLPACLLFFAGGIAFAVAHKNAAENVVSGVIDVRQLESATSVPDGAYVEVMGEFVTSRPAALPAVWHSWEAPSVAVVCETSCPGLGVISRVHGRVCRKGIF